MAERVTLLAGAISRILTPLVLYAVVKSETTQKIFRVLLQERHYCRVRVRPQFHQD